MCIRHETREKARQSLAFSRVSKPHTHITHMLRQCTSIVYVIHVLIVLGGLKYIPRLFSEYMLTFRAEEPMKICVTNEIRNIILCFICTISSFPLAIQHPVNLIHLTCPTCRDV